MTTKGAESVISEVVSGWTNEHKAQMADEAMRQLDAVLRPCVVAAVDRLETLLKGAVAVMLIEQNAEFRSTLKDLGALSAEDCLSEVRRMLVETEVS
jgi:ABC-type branched-subunit amino acid transport system ATPase component